MNAAEAPAAPTPENEPPPRASDRLEDLLGAANAASASARNAWLAFVSLTAFFYVTLGSVTHTALLLNSPVKLPILGIDLPLRSFFMVGPFVFVLVHFSVLLQHVMLTRKLRLFDRRCAEAEDPPNGITNPLREELNTYFFTQRLAGTAHKPIYQLTLSAMGWLTLLVLPLVLLLYFQVQFLAYHDTWITSLNRAALMADMAVLALTYWIVREPRDTSLSMSEKRHWVRLVRVWPRHQWPPMPHQDRDAPTHQTVGEWLRFIGLVLRDGHRLVGTTISDSVHLLNQRYEVHWRKIELGLIGCALLFLSLCVATVPDSALDKVTRTWLPSVAVPYDFRITRMTDRVSGSKFLVAIPCAPGRRRVRRAFWLTAWLFEGCINVTKGQLTSWFSRNLVVTDTDLVNDKDFPLENGEVSLRLRGRDLNYATFDRSDVHLADLTGARLRKASLSLAKLNKARLRRARLQGADLQGARLQGADLVRAQLQGANLQWAELQGAVLRGAETWLAHAPLLPNSPLTDFGDLRREPPPKEWHEALRRQVKAFEMLNAEMKKKSMAGVERVAEQFNAYQRRLDPLFAPNADADWTKRKEKAAWDTLAEFAKKPPTQDLACYLGKLACEDDTGKAHLARGLIRRVESESRLAPIFRAHILTCEIAKKIPPEWMSHLKRTAAAEASKLKKKAPTSAKPDRPNGAARTVAAQRTPDADKTPASPCEVAQP